ncbi:MAG: hypothetical protein ABIA63_02055 [bacterium]
MRLIKKPLIIFASLTLISCSAFRNSIPYKPIKANISDPISLIKQTIERQSPAYNPIQWAEVTDQYIKVSQLEAGYGPNDRAYYEVVRTVYYELIGDVKIFNNFTGDMVWYWWAELYDKSGAFMLYVYPLEENQTKRFVDALYIMMEKTSAPQ